MYRRQALSKVTNIVSITSRSSTQLTALKEDVCSYPPIIDMSPEGQKRHQRQLWYDSIKALPTVEQKLYELTVQNRPARKRYIIPSVPLTNNGLYFQRFITRTHLIHGLPEKLALLNVDKELEEILETFKETVALHYFQNWKCKDVKYRDLLNNEKNCSELVNLLVLQCYKKLGLKNDYILESTIQQTPRHESYWFHSGFHSSKDRIYEKNLSFQFKDRPAFTIRIKKPLNPILNLEDPICATAEVPDFNYHPTNIGFVYDKKWITSVPGYWFDDPCEYPLLLVKNTKDLKKLSDKLKYYDLEEMKESVGIMSSFGWLNAVATYQGFTPFHDLTYPLVTQSILTDGRDWNFFIYQLNTIAFHQDVDNKDKRNVCWSSGTIRLFETIEDGEIKGFNVEVFKILLKLLMNAPIKQENMVFKPYLGADDRSEEDITNMRFFYRQMYAQAPNPKAYETEVPTWQKIYMRSKVAKPMPFVRLY